MNDTLENIIKYT